MREILIITMIIAICSGFGVGFAQIHSDMGNGIVLLVPEVASDAEKDKLPIIADYEDFQKCQKICNNYCKNTSRPADCFGKCMRSCTP